MPEMLPDGTIKSSPMAISSNEPGKFLTIGMALEEITKGGIADQGLVNGLDYTIRKWNETEGKDRPITNGDLIQGLKLASVTEHSTSSEGSIYDTKIGGAGSGGPYLKEVLMLDIDHIRSKVNAGQEVKRTIGEIEKVYEENFAIGQHPPSSTFANNVVQMFSAFFEEGNIKDQIGDSLRKKTMSVFGVKTDDTALAYLQRSYDAQMKDSKNSSASAGARMEFYQNMLAYQLAVAIQGGTGGRTVSDQDVINMRKAFGNRLFSNGVVQLSVLKEIDSFVDDIIDSNKFLVESADGTVADAKAANAFHKMKANGLDLKTAATSYGSRATEAFGAMLDNRLTTGIENKAINIISPTSSFNIDGQKRAEFVNSEYVLPIPNFRKLTDKGAPTFGYSRGKDLMEIGQNIYISATRGEFDDKGIYALYRDSNELDKDGKKIVELQPNVTISMVSDYLEKLAQVARQNVEGQEYANKYYDHAKGFDK